MLSFQKLVGTTLKIAGTYLNLLTMLRPTHRTQRARQISITPNLNLIESNLQRGKIVGTDLCVSSTQKVRHMTLATSWRIFKVFCKGMVFNSDSSARGDSRNLETLCLIALLHLQTRLRHPHSRRPQDFPTTQTRTLTLWRTQTAHRHRVSLHLPCKLSAYTGPDWDQLHWLSERATGLYKRCSEYATLYHG
jgi:hypothetical protein